MKGGFRLEPGYIMKSALCGFLIAFNTVLFMNYFLDINIYGGSLLWFGLIDAALILLVAYPFREGGVIAITIIFLVFGYALYGPYAEYLAGPVSGIKESMSDMPELAEKQMHCMMLIFTNPMAYQQECGPDQEKVIEEDPEDFGLEIVDFEVLPDIEIYAKMPIQIRTVLENMGDYPAINVMISSVGEKFRNCEVEVLNISKVSGESIDNLRLGQTHHYNMMGKVNDPWKGDGECIYAQNKMGLDGTIETTCSYDYQTESYLELEAVRNMNEVKKFEVVSAREKAAPANVLMFTFIPLIWKLIEDGEEGSVEGYREAIIPISFQNERQKDKIGLRGENLYYTVYMDNDHEASVWCNEVCSEVNEPECMTDCLASYSKEDSKPHHCEEYATGELLKGVPIDTCGSYRGAPSYNSEEYVSCTMREEIAASGEDDCKNKTGTAITNQDGSYWFCANSKDKKISIKFSEELDCKLARGVVIYEVEGNYKRGSGDKITLSIVGEQAKEFVELRCDDSIEVSEDDVVRCDEVDGEINLVWLNNDLELKKGEKRFVYSGVIISLNDWPEESTKMNFGVKSHATYRVTITKTNTFKVNNPYYTSSPVD